ncbi:hypothetical protein FB451DRAFT_1167963 [Mycena latifolia]|nr:hypothetical protein FB451DRAFT_1167963 [Mycena latifolia]
MTEEILSVNVLVPHQIEESSQLPERSDATSCRWFGQRDAWDTLTLHWLDMVGNDGNVLQKLGGEAGREQGERVGGRTVTVTPSNGIRGVFDGITASARQLHNTFRDAYRDVLTATLS